MAGPVSIAPFAASIEPHLVALPVLLPLIAGALAAAVGGWSRVLSQGIGIVATLGHFLVCLLLLDIALSGEISVYSMGNWAAPFGIVLVLDRLSAMMILLTSTLAVIGLLYANAAWSDQGRRFQALWQFQIMGLSGAFLTGDLFNLFVFFEVLLAASYALLLHGGGRSRVGSTFHFVVVNLTASAVFLFAIGLLYAVTGTLNMAHLAESIGLIAAEDVGLVAVAGILLLTVFLVKSGLAPFHFWVPASYGSAAAPVVALIVAKVGAYSIVRVFPLLFGAETGTDSAGVSGPAAALANLAQPWVFGLAMLTLMVGAAGTLASQTLRQLAATLTLVSIGTLFVPLALGSVDSVSSAAFYLVHSTVATATLFLVAEWVGTHRGSRGDWLRPGQAISHPILIGGALLWAMITSVGLPPTSGFIGKILVLESVTGFAGAGWYWAAILVASFCSLVAVSRALSVLLWNHADEVPDDAEAAQPSQEHLLTPVQSRDGRAVGALVATAMVLVLSLGLVVMAGPIKAESDELAKQITNKDGYIDAVLKRSEAFTPIVRPSPAQRPAAESESGESPGSGGSQ
ncbi:MAG: monovalent cation/H+ antiporter subunit D [Burkholderiaceae bacterium]